MSVFKSEENSNEILIKCPSCGSEYLPSEIYYPNSFLGKPKEIIKIHSNGKLDYYLGHNMNLEETYCCDNCGCNFKVRAKVNFTTSLIDDIDFNKDTSTKIRKSELF